MANKYLDYNGVLYLWGKIKAKFALATDMTQAKNDITALQSVGAQANVIETVKRNGTALSVTNKAVDVSVPTKTSDLTNDSNYVADASYVHTDACFTADEKTKLAGIATGANKTTVDTALSSSSTNPVQNKVINTALSGKQATLTFDNAPTENSNNPVKSGGVYTALEGKQDNLTFDTTPTSGSTNPVTSGGVYTKVNALAPKASPSFTGTPKAPTAAQTVNNTQIATTAYVRTAVDGKANAATTLAGYGITDAYTKAEVDAAIETGTALTIDDAPTSGSDHLVKSGGVYTAIDNATSGKAPLESPTFTGTPTAPTPNSWDNSTAIATTAYVRGKLAELTTFSVAVLTELPTTGEINCIYFIPNSGTSGNVYDEYMWVSHSDGMGWEKIGTTEVDLSNYMQKSDMVAITNAEIDTIVAS